MSLTNSLMDMNLEDHYHGNYPDPKLIKKPKLLPPLENTQSIHSPLNSTMTLLSNMSMFCLHFTFFLFICIRGFF